MNPPSPNGGGSRRRPPRIAGVTAAYLPANGGVERYVSTVLSALRPGVDAKVLASDLNLRETGAPAPAGPPVVTYLASRRIFGERVLRLAPMYRALRAYDPDVVWTQHPSITGDIAGLFALATGRAWLATFHADLAPWKWFARPFGLFEARLLKRAQLVLVTSERYRQRLAARGIPQPRLRVFLLAPWIGQGHPPAPRVSEVGESDHAGPDHPFLFVGGLDAVRAYKRPEKLLEAMAELRSRGVRVAAWIVGDGDRRVELERLAATLGIPDQVEFLGAVDDVALATRYRRAWALVLPSDSEAEGFGTVCLEAALYGCPTITSDAVAAGDLLAAAGAARTYPAISTDGLARVLEEVWAGDGVRSDLARRTVAVAPSFAPERTVPDMAGPLYDMAVAAGRGHVGSS